MRPCISVVTLGVADVERSRRFYRDGLGLPEHPKPPVVYFALEGTWLALYEAERLARFAGFAPPPPGAARAVTLSCNVDSPRQVDLTLHAAVAAGAQQVQPPRAFSWGGYGAWFEDPDGHPWEIVYNPRPFAGPQAG